MNPKSGKFFAKAWREWLEKAKTDPAAQAKIDRVVKHPELELYDLRKDPWELNNLVDHPGYTRTVRFMHAQLQAEMKRFKDTFSTVDPKELKRAKQGDETDRKRKTNERKNAKKEKLKRTMKKHARKGSWEDPGQRQQDETWFSFQVLSFLPERC